MKNLRDPKTSLYDARTILRSRLRPLEPERNPDAMAVELELSDTEMLMLLEHVRLAFAADEAPSRDRYALASAGEENAPSFDTLRQDTWFHILLDRVVTPISVSAAASRGASASPGLSALLSDRFTVDFDFSTVIRGTTHIDEAIDAITAKNLRFHQIDCRTPAWVSARLWEQRPSVGDGLRWWLDRWDLLGRPHFSPTEVWGESEAQNFITLALDRLESEATLIGWDEFRQALANQSMRAAGRNDAAPLDLVPPLPCSTVARARWLDAPWIEMMVQMRVDAFEDVRGLVDLIAADVEHRRHASVADPQFVRLTEIAVARPDLLKILVQRALLHPLLAAELIVQPASCALGCWVLTVRALGQNFPAEDPQLSDYALAALKEALALLQRYLEEGMIAALPSESAALLESVFDTAAQPRRLSPGSKAESLVLDAVQRLGEFAAPIIEALAAGKPPSSLDAPAFIAALDLTAGAGLEEAIAPKPLPQIYMNVVRRGDPELSAERIVPSRAATLFNLAKRAGKPFLVSFLYPVDWSEVLPQLDAKQDDERDKIVRSLESAIRFLASAIVGMTGEADDLLVDALADHVTAGSDDDWSNGKVWAFGLQPTHQPWSRTTKLSIGHLLGQALSALDGEYRAKLLNASLELREPALLSHLHASAPHSCRADISNRIDEIGTNNAMNIDFWDGLYARIDALLDAGLTAAAERHIEATRLAVASGKAIEIPRIEFIQNLRLLYKKGDWQAIAQATVPDGLPQIERSICARNLDNYQAIALLQGAAANPEAAIDRFTRLAEQNPAELGHQVNLFAARLSATLGPKSFPILAPREQRPARQLIAEIENWIADTIGVTEKDRNICIANLAPLDLAVGDARRALERLQTLPSAYQTAPRMVYTAIAHGRLGHGTDAHRTLDEAADLFEGNPLIEAARTHLVGGPSDGGLDMADRLIFSLDQDEVWRLRDAMMRFQSSSPGDKATILRDGTDALPSLVIEYVDNALAGLSNLIPLINKNMLRDGEDDITAILKQILNGAFYFFKFSTPDQCKGGYTAKLNYGERDLILVDGNTEISIFEAVITDGSIEKGNLVSHFRKVLGYGDCQLYFHLTYAKDVDTGRLLLTLKDIARGEVPPLHAFEGLEERPRIGNEPPGFTARYRVEGRIIYVVFRIVDFGQKPMLSAAANAALKPNSPSRKPNQKNTLK